MTSECSPACESLARPSCHKTVRQVLHVVDVGEVHRHLVALLDLKFVERVRGRVHVDAHLVAVADHLAASCTRLPAPWPADFSCC